MRQLKITKQITPRSDKSLQCYLNEVQKYDLLTPEEETQLFQTYKGGDKTVLTRIVQANLRFVVSVAKKYMHCGLPLSDLINEGNEGLIVAAQRFDETRGFKFISYAVWWIRQRILQSINDNGQKIRKPLNLKQEYSKILRAENLLMQQHDRAPSSEELAEHLEMSQERVEQCVNSHRKIASLDAYVSSEEDSTLMSLMPDTSMDAPDDRLSKEESLRIQTEELLNTLGPKEREIIALAYGVCDHQRMHLQDIAERFDHSTERIRQICKNAIHKMQRSGKMEFATVE